MIKIPNVVARIKSERERRTFKEYGTVVQTIELADGPVQFAKWQHPLEAPGDFDQSHLDFFKQWVKSGDMAIDIGAFTGDTAVPMALAAGGGPVLALEPNPYVFKVLEENAGLNTDRTNIVPLNFAATDTDGSFTFEYSDASFCNGGFLSKIKDQAGEHKAQHKYKLEVQGQDFERYLRTNYADQLSSLTFIKIDAEGYDKEIIRSLSKLLKEFHPVVITECLPALDDGERHELLKSLTDNGYIPYRLNGFTETPTERLTEENSKDRSHFDILAVPEGTSLNR
ncbi:FkbM family methyltransferase [Patescibacteria group bacterium]|nr:FkbM family methyltransferase [Patescibacteria group bacterium]